MSKGKMKISGREDGVQEYDMGERPTNSAPRSELPPPVRREVAMAGCRRFQPAVHSTQNQRYTKGRCRSLGKPRGNRRCCRAGDAGHVAANNAD